MPGLCSQAHWISSVMSELPQKSFVLETSITNMSTCTFICFVQCNFKITLKWETSCRPHLYEYFFCEATCIYLMLFTVMSSNCYGQPGCSRSCEQFVHRKLVVLVLTSKFSVLVDIVF